MRRASVRYLTRHRSQLVLSVLGVALGVAVVLSIDLAIGSARAAFRVSAETVAGRATHAVVGNSGWIDEAYVARLRTDFDLRAAAPVVEGFATSMLLPGRALRILGVDPFSEGPFRPYVGTGAPDLDVAVFVTTRRGVVVSEVTAAMAGIDVGDSLPVLVDGERWMLPLVGVTRPSEPLVREGLADVLFMDVSGAQEILGVLGLLTRIDLRVAENELEMSSLERLRTGLPPSIHIEAVGTRAETMSGMIAAFDVNLTALSLLALIFGMFLIYNAVTFSVVQRRDIFGRLRVMGVTRQELVRLILTEASWIGAAGAVIGAGAGVVLARGLVRMVTRTINDLYFVVAVERVAVEPILILKAMTLGVVMTLIVSLPPALEAAAANLRLAALRSHVEERARRGVFRAVWIGLGVSAAGGLLLLLPTRSLAVSFGALFGIISGLALMTPAGTLALMWMMRPALRHVGGTLGLMAVRGVGTGLSRTAPAIAALVVAVSVTVGLGVMIQSFRGTLTRWLDGTLQADVYVSLPGPGASRASGTLWPELIDDFVAQPGVVGYSTYRGVDIVAEAGAFRRLALDLDPRGAGSFTFLGGRHGEVIADFLAGEGLIVSEPFAYRRGLSAGDRFALTTDVGPQSFAILGVFYDYGSDQGTVMMSRGLHDRFFSDRGVTSLGLFLDDGVDSETVAADLMALVPEGRVVVVRTNDTLRSASIDVFDRTFRVTAVLRLLAFAVAFVGLVSALMALELERAREFGLLRASGLTPGELWRLIVTQSGLMGLASGILAIPMGLILSIVMIFVVNKRSFGWTLNMQVGPDVIAQALALALVGALLAGLYPAWRMSRTSPAVALRGGE